MATKPAVKTAAKPAVKAVAKPAAKPVAKPVATATPKAAAKPAVKSAVTSAVKPVAKAAVKPTTKPAAKPVAKAVAKPAQAVASASPRLINAANLMGALDLADEFYAIAYNIETSMLNAGAKPGKDYTYLDLYKLAQPFVLELFQGNDKFSYVYPAVEVNKP
jgi:hypothetical protein